MQNYASSITPVQLRGTNDTLTSSPWLSDELGLLASCLDRTQHGCLDDAAVEQFLHLFRLWYVDSQRYSFLHLVIYP